MWLTIWLWPATTKVMDPQEFYVQLGKLIRERRIAQEFTQAQLAKALNISRASLANIETGRQNVFVHHLQSIAEQLDTQVEVLIPKVERRVSVKQINALNLKLPKNLNGAQREQVARFFLPEVTTTSKKLDNGVNHAVSTNRSRAQRS